MALKSGYSYEVSPTGQIVIVPTLMRQSGKEGFSYYRSKAHAEKKALVNKTRVLFQRRLKEHEFIKDIAYALPPEATQEERFQYAQRMARKLPWRAKEFDGTVTVYSCEGRYVITADSTSFHLYVEKGGDETCE